MIEPRWMPVIGRQGPFGISLARAAAVVLGIGVKNQRGGFVFLRELGFHAAIAFAIAREDDFAFDAACRDDASVR